MIYEILRHGRQNAKTAEQIAEELGLSKREATRQIAEEREKGFLILSGTYCRGYWLPEDNEKGLGESVRYLQSMKARKHSLTRVVRAQESAFSEWLGGTDGGEK